MTPGTRVLARVLLVVSLAAGVASEVVAQATPDADLQKLADAFSEAWGKGDGKAIAALHTKEAVRMSGSGEPAVSGTAAIEQAMTGALTGPYKGTTLTIKNNKYYRVNATTYIGEGTWEVAGGSVPAGTPTRGQYMNTMVREGGKWLIASSAVMPTPPAK